MDLQKAAEAETERRTRSKLEEHRRAIMALRAKKWTYRQIAKWLNERGVAVTFSSVYRFCERSIVRRPRAASPQEDNPFPSSDGQPASGPSTTQTTKHRFEELPI
jgi:hypothetical protein